MIQYGKRVTEETIVNYKVVKKETYNKVRTKVRNDAQVLAEIMRGLKNNAIGFKIIKKDGTIAYIDIDYELQEGAQ